jgi:N-acetylglucosaminyldiphosphoundecaprenol N-acetyl-beta-D-mannosaminyltransferase
MSIKSQKHHQISKIGVGSTRREKVLSSLRGALVKWSKEKPSGEAKLIVTPNPEIVNRAFGDKNLTKILNSADYSLLDGVGLVQAVRFLELPAPKNALVRLPALVFQGLRVGFSTFFDRNWLFKDLEIIKGREFFMDLVGLANKKGWRVFLLGGGGVSQDMKDSLQRSFKNVRIKAAEGPRLTQSGNPLSKEDTKKEKEIVEKVNNYAPQMLFVGFSPPKQEKWLSKWLPELKVGAAMTVGGTFEYMSGRAKLPPKWMGDTGLEWLWRLITRPTDKFSPSSLKRVKRVLTAFPIFPLKIFWRKLVG